jgi:hypothetical protein
MNVTLSPATYIALCGLVLDAMQRESDAEPILKRAANELADAVKDQLPADLADNPRAIEALLRTGLRDAA